METILKGGFGYLCTIRTWSGDIICPLAIRARIIMEKKVFCKLNSQYKVDNSVRTRVLKCDIEPSLLRPRNMKNSEPSDGRSNLTS